MNLNYKKIYDIYTNNFRRRYMEIWQNRMDDAIAKIVKEYFPRRKKATWVNLPEEKIKEIKDYWKPLGERVLFFLLRRENLLLELLKKVAKEKIDLKFTPDLHEVYRCSSNNYSSQPSRVRYAKGDAEQEKEWLEKFGVTCEIRVEDERRWESKYGDGYSCIFVVYANIEKWQHDYLSRQPYDLMDNLVDCWKKGINPQVKYHGMLNNELYDKSLEIFMGRATK